ncbi:MAG: galactitol-1-phosphate 5-dehydrogenase [Planctomycetes bacterium RBG_13_63_9]|nr:MAG: galactitol-1-phosphate 5-dehydrogenase [Planctomycetes bacterium RBG_13_63_9]
MKALVLSQYDRLDYQEVPRPQVEPEEVLVEVKACGICGSDVHGMDGSSGRRIPPIVMGHEASGVIAELGDRVSDWQVGDRVTFDSTVYCGRCHFCRRGEVNLCEGRSVLGVSCKEFRRQGAFAQYVAVPQRIVYRLPETLSFEHAAMVEPVSIAMHAVGRLPISLSDTAVVVGAGMIGLLAVEALRAAGCGRILAVDVDRGRLELAARLGADETFSPEETAVVAEVLRRTDGRGANVALEAVGIPATVATAIASVRKGGCVALVGNLTPQVDLPLQAVVTREITLYGSCASRGEYPAALEMIARGTIDVEPLVSAVAPLSEGAAWFRRLREGEEGLMKVILRP